VATYRRSIVPRMRTAVDLLMSKRHDYPSPTTLDGPLTASTGPNSWGNIGAAAHRYAQHADAWLRILSMWEREEFSIMFPTAPYFVSPLVVGRY
jgi:hypothetical protein